jgi:uncharacterized membrane protein
MKRRFFDGLAAGIVVAAWFLAVQAIPRLPASVPTHFRLDGTADGTGTPATLWLLPAVATFIYLILSFAQRLPARYINMPVKVTDRNRDAVYALAREMLVPLKMCAVLAIAIVEWSAIDAAARGSGGPYFAAATFAPIVLVGAVVIVYTIRMRAA